MSRKNIVFIDARVSNIQSLAISFAIFARFFSGQTVVHIR